MQRITAINPETATGKLKDLFGAVEKKLGSVPNMMRTMGASAAVLDGYLSLSGALSKGSLSPKMGEQIALVVAEANDCGYCASAHAYIAGQLLHIDDKTILRSRHGHGIDTKTDAGLTFAKTLVEKRGLTSDADVDLVFKAGFTEGEVGEIVAHVALNVLTNYFNNTADTVIDFPKVALFSEAA
ncbi:MAG: carboxymuconolactone decarboxylase family protein [Rhizobacter sp.]|nr:carboxymuconolactone decarboxylase family protein [Chlorobiales bacterium]